MAIESGPLFNNNYDVNLVDIPLLQQTDNVKTLIVLSQVNQRSYQLLSNNVFFKELFNFYGFFELFYSPGYRYEKERQKEIDHFFEMYYPDSCWKINCCVLLDPNFKFPKHIYENETEYMRGFFYKKIRQLENRLIEVQGKFYVEEEGSLLGEGKKQFSDIDKRNCNAYTCSKFYNKEPLKFLSSQYCQNPSDIFTQYINLEQERKNLQDQIVLLQKRNAKFTTNLVMGCPSPNLKNAAFQITDLRDFLKSRSGLLAECKIIQELFTQNQPAEEIRRFIRDQLPPGISPFVWQALMDKHVNIPVHERVGVFRSSFLWAHSYFKNHLSDVPDIIADLMTKVSRCQELVINSECLLPALLASAQQPKEVEETGR